MVVPAVAFDKLGSEFLTYFSEDLRRSRIASFDSPPRRYLVTKTK
jgi:hypothetical protein